MGWNLMAHVHTLIEAYEITEAVYPSSPQKASYVQEIGFEFQRGP